MSELPSITRRVSCAVAGFVFLVMASLCLDEAGPESLCVQGKKLTFLQRLSMRCRDSECHAQCTKNFAHLHPPKSPNDCDNRPQKCKLDPPSFTL